MSITFTDRELDIMNVLWEHGPSTAAEVRERLEDDLAYNTVLTMLRILEEKGYARHEEDGRAHRYFPLVERQTAGDSALGHLIPRLFRGSPSLLLTQMVQNRYVSDEDLKELREIIDRELGDAER